MSLKNMPQTEKVEKKWISPLRDMSSSLLHLIVAFLHSLISSCDFSVFERTLRYFFYPFSNLGFQNLADVVLAVDNIEQVGGIPNPVRALRYMMQHAFSEAYGEFIEEPSINSQVL